MDFYVILGLEPGATRADIKRAYRRLARRYHPDINPGDRAAEALFRQIAEAYETLSDPDAAQQYDAGGTAPATGAGSGVVRVRRVRFLGRPRTGAQAATFGELFAEVLHPVRTGGRRAARAGRRSARRR